MGRPPTFFASLAQDERHAVARRLSSKPRSDEWRQHIPRDCVRLLFDRRGPFARDIGALLPSIFIQENVDTAAEHSDPVLHVVDGVDDFVEFDVLRTLGDHLVHFVTNISFDKLPAPMQTHLASSSGLRALELSSSGSDSRFIDAICAHAATLECLSLRGAQENITKLPQDIEFPNLTCFEFDDFVWKHASNEDMRHVMQVLGPYLRAITWTTVKDTPSPFKSWQSQLLDVIQWNCPNLSRFILVSATRAPETFRTDYAKFLVSYGPQILRASLEIFDNDIELLRLVIEQCPNLLTAIVFIGRILGVDAMFFSYFVQLVSVAPRLRELFILAPISSEILDFDMSQCLNLRMVWACLSPDELRTLFSTPIPALEIIICLWTGPVENEQVFDVVADSALDVSKLHLEGELKGNSASESLLRLATSCRCLETLHLNLRIDEWNTFTEFSQKLIKELSSSCRSLRNLHLAVQRCTDDANNAILAQSVAESMEVFRFKDTLVTVGDKVFFS